MAGVQRCRKPVAFFGLKLTYIASAIFYWRSSDPNPAPSYWLRFKTAYNVIQMAIVQTHTTYAYFMLPVPLTAPVPYCGARLQILAPRGKGPLPP